MINSTWFELFQKILKRLLPISLMCIHNVSLSKTLIIPDADASDRGFKTQETSTVSAKY
jgi:hypothetical protein